jgi:RNA polymerase sigma factor (sigma-70 family)
VCIRKVKKIAAMQRSTNDDDNTRYGHRSTVESGDEVSDEALIRAIAIGIVWAMEQLYQRYSRLLYSLAYRMVSDHQIAEDLLQDAFVSVWKKADSYSRQSGTVRNWLLSIMHHRTIDYLRSVRRRPLLEAATLEDAEQETSMMQPDVWEEAWRSMQGAQVRQALMQLPTEQRMVIELAYFQGWTQAEIASGCQIPLGTVKARMRLGLIRMKNILDQMGVREL